MSYAYYNQMAVNSVTGSATYVQNTTYDAAERVDVRTLGLNALKTDYNYNPWTTQAGRLQQIMSGIPSVPDSRQKLQYTYASNGNVLTIQDYKSGNPQTQTFTYDDADRILTAGASNGGAGNYGPDSYGYDGTTGNLNSKASTSLTYNAQSSGCPSGALSKGHAATAYGSNTYCYDPNGNMERRTISGVTYSLTYDAENHLTGVSGGTTATFVYDGDGKRVKGTAGGITSVHIGNYFEWTGSTSTMKKYLYAGEQRVAMAVGTTIYYLLSDHLGSTMYTVDTSGGWVGTKLYKAWGENRYESGVLPTNYRFTGQYDEGIYLYNYGDGTRFYDPYLSRFAQADSITPDQNNPQSWDRYAYSYNNPVKYTDPNGHDPIPYDQFIRQAATYIQQMGYSLVGTVEDVIDKGIYTNGADMVFKKGTEVLGVELKNLSGGSVNLGTLGKALTTGNYGGSLARLYASAGRFYSSTNQQLREESQAIYDAYKSGNLQNALYTNVNNVSEGAQNLFNNVYTEAKNTTANVIKGLGPTGTAVGGAIQTGLNAAGTFLSSCETMIGGIFFYKPFDLYNTAIS